MTDTTIRESLLAAVYRQPTARLPKLALADWYEEQGDTLRSACWRELAARNHRYYVNDKNMNRYWVISEKVSDSEMLGGKLIKAHSLLPDDWVRRIRDNDWFDRQETARFDTAADYWNGVVEGYVEWKTDRRGE